MSLENVKSYLKKFGFDERVMVFSEPSATVEQAALAVGDDAQKIAKSLTFMVKNKPVMIVCAGDMKIDNTKFKAVFETKAVMLQRDEVENLIGHKVGGVCPFAINSNVDVYLDESLKRFDYVYPACGNDHSAIKITVLELAKVCQNFNGFIDVCKSIM